MNFKRTTAHDATAERLLTQDQNRIAFGGTPMKKLALINSFESQKRQQ